MHQALHATPDLHVNTSQINNKKHIILVRQPLILKMWGDEAEDGKPFCAIGPEQLS